MTRFLHRRGIYFPSEWRRGRAVRLLGVGVSGLNEGYRQMSIWDIAGADEERLQMTLDELRQKYGRKIVQRGI